MTLARRKASAAGAPAPPGWQDAPWVWIASAGMALLIVSLIVFGLTSGVDPGTNLVPPTWVDGVIMPSGVPPGTVLEAPQLIDGEIVPSHPLAE